MKIKLKSTLMNGAAPNAPTTQAPIARTPAPANVSGSATTARIPSGTLGVSRPTAPTTPQVETTFPAATIAATLAKAEHAHGGNPALEHALSKIASRAPAPSTSKPATLNPAELRGKLARIRAQYGLAQQEALQAQNANIPAPPEPEVVLEIPPAVIPLAESGTNVMRGKNQITLADMNAEQLRAIRLAEQNQSFCLVGSAGSGKTTTTKMIAEALLQNGQIREIRTDTTSKHLRIGAPTIVFVSFTNQAVTNIKEAVPAEFKGNCLTIHKLLEYAPIFYEVDDPISGEPRKTMRYEPQKGPLNKLHEITHVVVEEAGSVEVQPLFRNLMAALPPNVQFIFLGDLNQLPPVFGDAILGFKLLELPVVELVHSYRTDGTSPIRLLAYKILEGKPLNDSVVSTLNKPGELELVRFKDRVDDWEKAVVQMGSHLASLVDTHFATDGTEGFNYLEDVILCPFVKKFGTGELNKYIAQRITEHLKVPTYEIVCGVNKVYYAVGDIVYYNKNKWRIVDIVRNAEYLGKSPQVESLHLNRWGVNTDIAGAALLRAQQSAEDMEAIFHKLAAQELASTNESNFQKASHCITLEDFSGEREPMQVDSVGELNAMYLAYALTVHKSQGSEWNRVFCIFHSLHATMMQRELLYTAVTRARKFLRVYFSGEDTRASGIRKTNDSVFQKGILKQRIPGNTLEAKLNFYRSKLKAEALKLAVFKAKQTGTAPNLSAVQMDAENARMLLAQLMRGSLQGTLADTAYAPADSDDSTEE